MKDIAAGFTYALTDLDRADWIAKVDATCNDFGDVEPVGFFHKALFIDAGRTLLVTFESIAGIRRNNDEDAPLGWSFVASHGWSSLTLLADAEPDWFRVPAVYGYFDRLIDDGFFDDFDQVLFYGAGAAGYAAAAYSVAAPECRVLVIQPQATLDHALARWDTRFPATRRSDFTSRFGYAPMMVETAEQVWVVHDPSVIEDAMHACLFNGPNTTHLTCPYIGPQAERGLMAMDVLSDMIEQAAEGTLNRQSFASLWRIRQTHMPYLRTLFHRLDAEDTHPRLLARLCRKVGGKGNRPMFSDKLAELEAAGVTL